MLALFELSGEHATLPIAEIRGICEAEEIECMEVYHNRIAIFEINDVKKIAARVSMSHSINEIIGIGGINEIEKVIKDMELNGSFRIEVVNYDKKYDSYELKKKFGKLVSDITGCKVSIKNPQNIIKIFSYKKLYLTKEIAKIDRKQYEMRKAKIFQVPISMHPRLARAMVNIARVKKSQIVVDPFCGTGTILIEAALAGAKVIGIEAKNWIAEGCRENMEYFGIDCKIYNDDMRNVDLKADAVVTDFPYGRAAYVGEEIKKLYGEAFEKIDEWIESGYIMVGLSNRKEIDIGKKFFELVEIHPYRVHKSLTRFFALFKK